MFFAVGKVKSPYAMKADNITVSIRKRERFVFMLNGYV